MKIILKNLKQVQYNVEMESEKNTIKDLKNEIEKLHGFDSNLIKLLHNGKVLEDSKTLEEYQIKDENVIIMMNTKPKVKAEAQPTEQAKPSSPKKEEQPKKEEEKPKTNTSTNTNTNSNTNSNSDKVNQLVEMGYEKEKVEKALNAANGNIQLAIEFLTSGMIPERPPSNQLNQQYNQPSSSGSLPPELKTYASLIKVVCHDQPDKIFGILNSLKQRNPDLINLIKEKQEDFKNYLVSPINQDDINAVKAMDDEIRANAGRRQIRINLTPEDREAINRLKNLGDFNESDIIQAYFACEKNEELAANYLFEQKLRDEDEQNNNQGQ